MDVERETVQGNDSGTPTQVDGNQATKEPLGQEQPSQEEATNRNKRKLTSDVWENFNRIVVNGEIKSECKACFKKLAGGGRNGTSHLREHMNNTCKRRRTNDIRQQVLTGQKTTGGQSNISCYNFDANKSRKDLAEMIIVHEYPLVMVEHHGFRKFVGGLQPFFKVPSRNTVKSDILKIYDFEKQKTMRILEKNTSKIAITTDMWTASNQKKGFMAITAHFIDNNWHMQSRIMRFIYVPCPHTAEVLTDVLYESLCDWNIDRKISTVTVDNCTTNNAMIDNLLDKLPLSSLILGGELFHMRCSAHIINLIVQDGLSVIGDGIVRIRDSVGYWTATPKRMEKFEEAALHLEIPSSRKLALYCKTRWNSTYLMLEVAVIYKDVFKRLKQRDTQYQTLITEKDWELASKISKKLVLFYNVTLLFSGTKYPTTNTFFTSICDIRCELNKWSRDQEKVIRDMAGKMLEKFDKYWSDINGFMGAAAVLDPRMRLKIMKYSFPKLYHSKEKSNEEFEKLKSFVTKLFQEYKRNGEESEKNQVDCLGSTSKIDECGGGFYSGYSKFVEEDEPLSGNTNTSELDHYVEEKVCNPTMDLDILAWWKTNGMKYPTLQKIARDLLAIPVSTVASESCFSTGGRLVTPHRNRLHPTTLEALMCGQSWLLNEIRATCSKESETYCQTIDYAFDDEGDKPSMTE